MRDRKNFAKKKQNFCEQNRKFWSSLSRQETNNKIKTKLFCSKRIVNKSNRKLSILKVIELVTSDGFFEERWIHAQHVITLFLCRAINISLPINSFIVKNKSKKKKAKRNSQVRAGTRKKMNVSISCHNLDYKLFVREWYGKK